MTIAAIITLGIGPGGSVKFALTGGLGLGAQVVVTVTSAKRPGPAPGSFRKKKYQEPARYYLPPGWKEDRKPTLEQVQELYAEARAEIPIKEQKGLLPAALRLERGVQARLPPPQAVDFKALRANLGALRAIFAALQEARAKEQRRKATIRRQEEEFILTLILNHEIDEETVRRRSKEQEFITAILDNNLRSIDVQGRTIRFYSRRTNRTDDGRR